MAYFKQNLTKKKRVEPRREPKGENKLTKRGKTWIYEFIPPIVPLEFFEPHFVALKCKEWVDKDKYNPHQKSHDCNIYDIIKPRFHQLALERMNGLPIDKNAPIKSFAIKKQEI